MPRQDIFKGIMRFTDEYGFITTKICANIFYKNATYSLNMAQRTLKKLVDKGYLKVTHKREGKEGIYQYNNNNAVSDHRYYMVNLYSLLYKYSDEVIYFKQEETWGLSKRRSDAHIIIGQNINGNIIPHSYLVEFDKYSKTGSNKYNEIYATNEVQQWYLDNYGMEVFPDVIQINPLGKATIESNYEFDVISIDYNIEQSIKKITG